jgi:transposase
MYYIGLDVHKKTISYCVKDAAGQVHQEGKISATRRELDAWIKTLPQPRMIAVEATIFTGWIYDHLLPHAERVKVAHPLMLRAIAAAKKKNDKIDAGKIADCLRCDFLPECHMASTEIRDRRRTLRYRNLVLKQMVQMKNRVSGLLMESGVSYDKRRLHKMGYFTELFSTNEEISDSIRPLLRLGREHIQRAQRLDRALTSSLEHESAAVGTVETAEDDSRSGSDHRADVGLGNRRLHAIQIGQGSHQLLRTVQRREEFCRQGDRMPISKQRNKHIQHVLVEAAKMAPRYSHELALVREKEIQRGNKNRATLPVAWKMVAYMLAVERRQQDFVPAEEMAAKAVA